MKDNGDIVRTCCFERNDTRYLLMCEKFKQTINFIDSTQGKNDKTKKVEGLLKNLIEDSRGTVPKLDMRAYCPFAFTHIIFSRTAKVITNVVECPFKQKKVLILRPKK